MLSLTLIQLAVVALVTIQKVSHATGANIVDFEDKFVTTAVISINGHLMRLDNVASRRLLEAAAAANLTLQTPEEADYLQFHRCFDEGEAYAAAYLITKEHILNHRIDHELQSANTELASFIVFDNRNNEGDKEIRSGTITMALDIFDFSIVHLSAYERLVRRHGIKEKPPFHAIENCTANLLLTAAELKQDPNFLTHQNKLSRTVAIMPWLGNEIGVGNSHVENRISYLKACFWSIYPLFPSIAIGVQSAQDFAYLKNQSGLPIFDVMMLDNMTEHRAASLPLATLQAARLKIMDKIWDFDYVYFTESDQVLLIRPEAISDVYGFLDKYPRRTLVPHRLIPYPAKLLRRFHRKDGPAGENLHSWTNMTCCMPRQNCIERKSWVRPPDAGLPFADILGLQVALGNANFHEESFRACRELSLTHIEVCP